MDFLIERAKMLESEIIEQFMAHRINVAITGGQIIPGLRRYIFKIKPMPGTNSILWTHTGGYTKGF